MFYFQKKEVLYLSVSDMLVFRFTWKMYTVLGIDNNIAFWFMQDIKILNSFFFFFFQNVGQISVVSWNLDIFNTKKKNASLKLMLNNENIAQYRSNKMNRTLLKK